MKLLKECNLKDIDVAIFGLGYESRSLNIFLNHSPESKVNIALGYTYHTRHFCYQDNLNMLSNEGAKIVECNDNQLRSKLREELASIDLCERSTILVDITVMSRPRLGEVLWTIMEIFPKGTIIHIVYTLSQFTPPAKTPPVKEIGSIVPELEGALGNLDLPSALVVSLGYEQGKALGAANYVDAGTIYALMPISREEQFEASVRDMNKDLLKNIPKENIINYDVHSPYSTYLDIKSLLANLSSEYRPIFLPLGPKIMAATGVVMGKDLFPQLPVWRVSSGEHELPVNRKASEHVIKMSVRL